MEIHLDLLIKLATLVIEHLNNSSNISQPSNSENLPSQPLSNPWGHIEPKGMEIVHSISSKVNPSKLPSELQFEWEDLPNLNFIGPQHYALLETDDQLGALDGVLDKKETKSLELNAPKIITCGESEFKSYSEHLHKLHNNRARVGAFSLKKHLGPWQLQEKIVDSHRKGWTNHVWDPGKSFKNHNFWGVITCVGAFRALLSLNWDPLEPTKFKHWWGFKDEFKHKPP
ncbi:hypothetical protein PIB30_046557 [Stylosanthes scabra]|uniref:Uncharacterized protein n=1 Tax=Stylosanthes scabra TaxID=79078 RepID=A0ABU6VEQ3_9FABA|nr:hypothetical protein [Stylosanthes scabra]